MKTNILIKNADAKKIVIGLLEDRISNLESDNDKLDLTCRDFARDASKTSLDSKDLKASFEAYAVAIVKINLNEKKIEIFKKEITNLKSE